MWLASVGHAIKSIMGILVTASGSYKALRRYKKYHVNNIGVGVMKVSVQCLHVLPTTR